MDKPFSVTLDSAWDEPENIEQKEKEWKAKYNVIATFHDGGDYYSSWTLCGAVENVKECIVNEWCIPGNHNFADIIDDEEKLETLIHA